MIGRCYEFYKISTWGSISQYGALQLIMSDTSSLYFTQLAGREPNNFQQQSKLLEIKVISTT